MTSATLQTRAVTTHSANGAPWLFRDARRSVPAVASSCRARSSVVMSRCREVSAWSKRAGSSGGPVKFIGCCPAAVNSTNEQSGARCPSSASITGVEVTSGARTGTAPAGGCQLSGAGATRPREGWQTATRLPVPTAFADRYAALVVFSATGSVISSLRVFASTLVIGIVISSTPSCIVALASSGFTPSGSGTVR